MSILIQPEKSLVIGNRREPNILNLQNKIREPMKRRVIIILALLLSIWKWHWSKFDINFSDKGQQSSFFIVIMMNETFFANFLLQLSSLSDLRELRSALIILLSCLQQFPQLHRYSIKHCDNVPYAKSYIFAK